MRWPNASVAKSTRTMASSISRASWSLRYTRRGSVTTVPAGRKFGAAGDFVTAPELGALFARCLAQPCAQVLTVLGGADILEAGAGSGALAADLLRELEALDSLPRNYFILELSAELRARQAQTLKLKVPHLFDRAHWLETFPAKVSAASCSLTSCLTPCRWNASA